MKWVGYRKVPVKSLVLPGDIGQRMAMPRVMDLARSIELLGAEPIHAPSIEDGTNKLIAGRDRMAALMRLKVKTVVVHVAGDVTEQDLLDLEIDENLHRRQDNRDALIARRVAKVEGELPDNLSSNTGRPKSKKGAAREQVARELDTTPEAVRAAERRASPEVEKEEQPEAELPPPVECYGLPLVTEAEAQQLRVVQSGLGQVDAAMKRAQGVLSPLVDLMPDLGLDNLLTQIHLAAAALRAAVPRAVCPFCKRRADRIATCGGCGTTGFVGGDVMLAVADELRLGGDKAMVADGRGKLVPYAAKKIRGAAETATQTVGGESLETDTAHQPCRSGATPAASRKLQIQDADGKPIDLSGPASDEDLAF